MKININLTLKLEEVMRQKATPGSSTHQQLKVVHESLRLVVVN